MIRQHKFGETTRLYNLGDVHRGNKNCSVKFFHDVIKTIAEDKNAYWISTGDLLEVATTGSVSDTYSALSPNEELEILSEELSLISDKCLGFTSSNHHHRTYKETGISLDKTLSARCGIPYLGDHGLLNITIGQGSYFIVLHHGTGGGSEGNAVNRALKATGNHAGADCYLSGHTHKAVCVPFNQQIIDRKRSIVRNVLSYSIVTGHFLEWKGSYAERMGLKPAPIGAAFIDLGINHSGREETKSINPGFLSK